MSPTAVLFALTTMSNVFERICGDTLLGGESAAEDQSLHEVVDAKAAAAMISTCRSSNVVGLLCLVLNEDHLEAINAWGSAIQAGSSELLVEGKSGGGATGDRHGAVAAGRLQGDYGAVVGSTIEKASLVLRCIAHVIMTVGASGSVKEDAVHVLDAMLKHNLVALVLKSLRAYSTLLSVRCVASCVTTLSELVFSRNQFLVQFVRHQGLECFDELPSNILDINSVMDKLQQLQVSSNGGGGYGHDELEEEERRRSKRECSYRLEAVIGMLQVASQLARESEIHFPSLEATFTPLKVVNMLLANVDELELTLREVGPAVTMLRSIKARCCNLLGNLCRHSGRIYPTLVQPLPHNHGSYNHDSETTVVSALITCCGDLDSSTRKFACFAVGNAAFHSPNLYKWLAPSISILASVLGDADEKTRANAAGAIGNLIRNSGELSGAMEVAGIPQKLLKIVVEDRDITPKRIALFSLGTMAVYAATRRAIMGATTPSLKAAYQTVKSSYADDEVLQKYLQRLVRHKLKAPLVGGDQ